MPTPPTDPLHGASDALRALAARGEQRRFRKHSVLINEGESGDTLYVILAGRLRAYASGDKEREITYGVYGAGEYVGEMSLDGGPRAASVITLEPSVCSLVTRRTLEAHIAEHPQFAFELLAKVIRRARTATLSAKQMALNDVYGRLRLLLDDLAVPQADGSRLIAGRLTHAAIASRLGCSREMVSRLTKDLERGGHVAVTPRGLLLSGRLPQRW
jgi:CRP/FNR family cyclic AMP-dependent transcriptional regulator